MVEICGFDIEIVDCPIKREDDGLALSSRNVRLTPENRAIAPMIYKTLCESVAYAKSHTVDETRKMVIDNLNAVDGFEVEYYEIVDPITMQPIHEWKESVNGAPHGCITVYCGEVRLIDNIKY